MENANPIAWRICHPNPKGNGCAIEIALVAAYCREEGYIRVRMANQNRADAVQGSVTPVYGFDWPKAICFRLSVMDVAQFLAVLMFSQESIADGKGLFKRTDGHKTVVQFHHQIEPRPCYCLNVSQNDAEGNGEIRRAFFMFGLMESFALREILRRALVPMAFGIPTDWRRYGDDDE